MKLHPIIKFLIDLKFSSSQPEIALLNAKASSQ